MKEKLLSLTHSGETPEKYFHAVTPPVFLTSLHIYDRFEDYADADILKEDEYIYGRDANPTVSILERLQNWSMEAKHLLFHQEWLPVRLLLWRHAEQVLILSV